MRRTLMGAAMLVLSLACFADVTSSTDLGFESKNQVKINASPGRIHRAFTKDVGKWWHPDHTYSGKSENLAMDVKPGGLFIEKLEDNGFVTHMQILYVAPGKMVRLSGALGPLQEHPVSAVLTMSIQQQADGLSLVVWTYRVGGYFSGGLKSIAPIVDRVMAEQLGRLKTHLDP